MRKIFILIFIFVSLFTSVVFAQSNKKIFPEQGIISFSGMDDTSTLALSKDNHSADIQNITLSLVGEGEKRNGYSYFSILDTNDLVDAYEAVTGIYELYKSNGTRTKLSTCGNKLFSISQNARTQLYYGLTEGQNNQFVWTTALDYVIGTNDVDLPIQTDGTTASAVSFSGLTNPITKARCVAWWKNYLIFGNTVENSISRTTRIRWSNVGTINTWSDDDFVDISTLSGQIIEGFGILQDNLFIFFTDSIYRVSLVGGDELIVITKVSENLGAIAKNSIKNISIGNREGLVFVSRDSTINFLDGVNITEISVPISGIMDNLSSSRLPYAVSANDSFNGHYYLAITDGTDPVDTSINNLLLDYYYTLGEWFKHVGIKANAMGVANDTDNIPQIYFGNHKSIVYQFNNSNFNDDVVGFTEIIDSTDITDTTTSSGQTILYDTNLSNYTILLSHFEGVNGSNSFTDEALHTITANGNVQISTLQSKFGTASVLFDGSGDYLSLADSDDWNFGSGDFTIDFWVRWNTTVSTGSFYYQRTNPPLNQIWFTYNGTQLVFYDDNAGTNIVTASQSWSPSANTWYHVALVRSGDNFKIFVDGTQLGSDTSGSGLSPDIASSINIGARGDIADYYFDGWIDEFRVSKGIARWTSNFTPSTSAYDNSDNSGRFLGATIKIISGAGKGEERIICATTSTGLVITNTTSATSASEYSIGLIDSFITTKWLDCGNSSIRKNFTDLYLWITKKSTSTMDLYYASDEVSTIQSLALTDYVVSSLSGENIASGLTSSTWGGEELSFARFPLNISGRFLKVKYEEDNYGETMNLVGYSLIYDELDVY